MLKKAAAWRPFFVALYPRARSGSIWPMDYHPVVGKITGILSEKGAWFETFEHEPVRTSEEAARIRTGYTLEQGTKALIVRVRGGEKGKRFVMLVVPGDKKFDEEKLKNNIGLSDVRFATEAEVGEMTGGVLPGGVPPFGNLFGLDVYADQGVFDNERIVFNAGDRRYSVAMRSSDYRDLVAPAVADIAAG